MPSINDRSDAYIQSILDRKTELARHRLAAQRKSLGHRIRQAIELLGEVPDSPAMVPASRLRRHVLAMKALARSADDLYLYFEGLEPVAWLKPEPARQHILDMAQELGKVQDWLTDAMARFHSAANDGLTKPGGEIQILRDKLQRSEYVQGKIHAEARRQKRRAGKAESEAANWEQAARAMSGENARLAQALLQKLIPTQRTNDSAPPQPVVDALSAAFRQDPGAQQELDAFKAAILIEHAAVPNHGRYSGQHECWEPFEGEPCACHDKPKVCRSCRTYTGDEVEYPCRTAEIALGES